MTKDTAKSDFLSPAGVYKARVLVWLLYIKSVLLLSFFRIFSFFSKKYPEHSPGHKILVINSGRIGDMVLSTPVLRALKKHYSNTKIDLLAPGYSAPVLEDCPYLHKIHLYPGNKIFRQFPLRYSFFYEIYKEGYDMVIILSEYFATPVHMRYYGQAIAFIADAPLRYGPQMSALWLKDDRKTCNTRGQKADIHTLIRTKFLTDHGAFTPCSHAVHTYADVISFAGIEMQDFTSELWPQEEDKSVIEMLLQQEGVEKDDFLFLVNPHSGNRLKCWYRQGYAEVIRMMHQGYNVKSVIIGLPADTEETRAIISESGVPSIDFTGRLTLKQIVPLIERADLLLTCDSGPMHIATAVRTSQVILFGPTNPREWGPYYPDNAVVIQDVEDICVTCTGFCREEKGARPCMKRIAPDTVFSACAEFVTSRD